MNSCLACPRSLILVCTCILFDSVATQALYLWMCASLLNAMITSSCLAELYYVCSRNTTDFVYQVRPGASRNKYFRSSLRMSLTITTNIGMFAGMTMLRRWALIREASVFRVSLRKAAYLESQRRQANAKCGSQFGQEGRTNDILSKSP